MLMNALVKQDIIKMIQEIVNVYILNYIRMFK